MSSPFHRGEKQAQERAGVREMAEQLGQRMVRDFMPDQHREFFQQLPILFVGSVDEGDRPWASALVGRPGFARSPDPRRLVVEASPLPHDPLGESLKEGVPLGLLGLEFHTRRRNRLNGQVVKRERDSFELEVGQSFGNCPQYIQKRRLRWRDDTTHESSDGAALSAEGRALVEKSDTFFIASFFEEQGVDVSHRGGKPGFVKVETDTTLTFPDFSGNNHFNTIGNLSVNPRAGLLFLDFESGDILYLTVTTEIVWEGPEVASFAGAQRLLKLQIEQWRLVKNSLPFSWQLEEYSPTLEGTGSWANPLWREYAISRIEVESPFIKSFYLSPTQGEVPSFRAGQFLPVRVPLEDGESVVRTYSLSGLSGESDLRITVKREKGGRGSVTLHNSLSVGQTLYAQEPGGQFVLNDQSTRPLALVSAGVGITPLLSMWKWLAEHQPDREAVFVHGVRNGKEHVLREEVEELVGDVRKAHFRYSRPAPDDRFDSVGRIDIELLQSLIDLKQCEFYLCGPEPFLRGTYEGLVAAGVLSEHVHFESFGSPFLAEEAEQCTVEFQESGSIALWNGGTLLELAEKAGLKAPFSCRAGACGECRTKLLSGGVEYVRKPSFPVSEGEVLLCSAKPSTERLALSDDWPVS